MKIKLTIPYTATLFMTRTVWWQLVTSKIWASGYRKNDGKIDTHTCEKTGDKLIIYTPGPRDILFKSFKDY